MTLSPVFTFYSFPSLFALSFLFSSPHFVEGRLFYSLFSLSFSFFRLLFLFHLFGYFVVSLFLAESVIYFRFILLPYPLPLSFCDCLLFHFFATPHLFFPLYVISSFIPSLIQKPHSLCKIGRLNPGWESFVLDCLCLRR